MRGVFCDAAPPTCLGAAAAQRNPGYGRAELHRYEAAGIGSKELKIKHLL